ncbi:MAG: class I SAM-dependent methyltransferase family protein [Nanoarchaeota archaeon]|nr:class I SAM-dependent methyltransferase family protein [Nanoarchaeota archaeon]
MVRSIEVDLKDAQHVKKELLEKQEINLEYRPIKENGKIYFPVTESYSGETTEKDLQESIRPKVLSFKEALEPILTPQELEIVKTAYDVAGNIAIIEVPLELQSKEKGIGEALLSTNPLIKTVLRKDSGHDGVFRTQDMKYLAGEETKVATYKENNCTLTFNVEEVYFSVRLSTERKRISDQVQEGENILVMFSGAAPYPCVLAKNTLAEHIVGVEINPQGHEFGLLNVKKNKLQNVELHCGDVREVVPTISWTYDRIIMPLPKTAEEFLDVALPVANKGCTIHLYGFYHEEEFDKAVAEIDKYCKAANRNYEIKEIVKCGQQSPRTYRICVDFVVN